MVFQRQQQRRLCFDAAAACCAVIFFLYHSKLLLGQLLILLLLLAVSQHTGRFSHDSCADRIIQVCNKLLVRCTHDLLSALHRIVKRQPVAKVEYISPAMVVPIHFRDVVHPRFHAHKLIFQNALVPVKQIQIPRNDARRIAPDTRCILDAARRHHVRHLSAEHALLFCHVVQVFCIECIRIFEIHRRRREHLRITRPSHALITLRAVGRNIHKIAL